MFAEFEEFSSPFVIFYFRLKNIMTERGDFSCVIDYVTCNCSITDNFNSNLEVIHVF